MLPAPADHVAISDLVARYCLMLDLDDVEGWVGLFTPDASYLVYGRSFDGHDALRAMMRAAPGGMHLGGPPSIEMLGPDQARTTRNLLFVDQAGGAPRHAIYHDDLVRTPDGWRIGRCRCQFVTPDGLADRPARPKDQAPRTT
ncbi:nuclear transport factor 2 family protein [Frankia sp. AgB1.9]|uniref:nuclear transport factor 2 family protein n=1 Tax=unclassified Frankia TaxID=2632575 RepID=UPI001931D590|nr:MULTISPECIES: nuclear transport factor 2 family protein [unclassified Frankia]MBL7493217.1 nuclear transport factor 2 family protein [Frankia sp. AgW1.1]MBL7548775.1 nuclear transport factor 2 family protein [Frankia sp. AgB1.9]MBL7623893.1 nuclear transport factor 2 family protein [Frankia sp. AgB1.8]